MFHYRQVRSGLRRTTAFLLSTVLCLSFTSPVWASVRNMAGVPEGGVNIAGEDRFSVGVTAADHGANPQITVQYYANIETVAYNDPALREVIGNTIYTNELPVIDTTGRRLPSNGGGSTESPNGNEIRNLYVDMTSGKLQTKTELMQILTDDRKPLSDYGFGWNKLQYGEIAEHYELAEVWLLKPDRDPDSTDRNDWDIYPADENFFEFFELSNGDIMLSQRIQSTLGDSLEPTLDGRTVIRYVYDQTDEDVGVEAAFYDYDIGDGMIYSTQLNAQKQANGKPTSTQGSGTHHMHTNQSGINSPGNYTGSGAKLAFGNANTGSGLQHELWGGNLLNKANRTQSGHPGVTGSYNGCTFGLVTGLDEDGHIKYADGVNVPNLFNDGKAAGKTAYDNDEFGLTFHRVGDTYTLTAVSGTETSGLDTFNHPSPNASTVYNHIWTNNFWPMDAAPSFGTDGHDMKFGDYTNRENYKFAGQAGSSGGSAAANGTFPWSDDGEDHNSYFGMYYQVDFSLIGGYVGPLEYYFFGDDDMWVFLDGELICDIGGVHSSVGEYVNLWDYLEKGSTDASGEHTLSFFYTERGESGSTCWMQFTLPAVSYLVLSGSFSMEQAVSISKTSDGGDPDDEFIFNVHVEYEGRLYDVSLPYMVNGDPNQRGTLAPDGTITLKSGDRVTIGDVPSGAVITVTEEFHPSYLPDEAVKQLEFHAGPEQIDFLNTYIPPVELPHTGGTGTSGYYLGGLVFVGFGVLLGVLYRKRKRTV